MKKILLVISLFLLIVCLLCSCNETHVHDFGEWTITKPATCQETGEQERYCSCGEIEVQEIPRLDHTPVVDPYIAPTCASNGWTEGSHCSVCNIVIKKRESIAKLSHEWDEGTITSEPTCTEKGEIVYKCTNCETTKTDKLPELGHNIGEDNICTRCGRMFLNMTEAELDAISKCQKYSHGISETKDSVTFSFSFTDINDNELEIPVCVDVKIINDEGKVVYNEILVKPASQSSVVISKKDIHAGNTEDGTIYYTVYNLPYFTMRERTATLCELPWYANISRPKLPVTVSFVGETEGTIYTSCEITSLSYTVKDDDLYLYVSGVKTFDQFGDEKNDKCLIGVELYDSKGTMVVKTIIFTNELKVGERFVEVKGILTNCIAPGETYTLKLVDAN